ncbi:MAG: IPT/TIG domain-containing protein [Deltaproteobacteria bacterium]|nr:IPT/TIG domain-containing protein [Deltaproteobacteria bacterium]
MSRSLVAWMTCGLLLGLAPAAHATELLEAIDVAHRAGKITDDERILQRVTAVRAPERLADAYPQAASSSPSRARSQTPVLVDAFQRLPQLEPSTRAQVQELLDPPPPLSLSIERDDVFPFRVSYSSPALADKAERVLEAAETSYLKQVEQWGFWAPALEPGSDWYEIFLMDPGSPGVAGYTSPYLENAATPRADTHSYIVIGDSYDGVLQDSVVTHEFNHACQLSMDASEQLAFLENTATYIETAVYPASWPYNSVMFPAFQSHPYRPLEYSQPGSSDGYEYGGALWVVFLEHLYGANDPSWIRQIWEGSVQDGWLNEPDYFDALDGQLAEDGGLAEAVRVFAEYRYFVGADDDGHHLPDAWQWGGAEVWRTASWTTSHLPLIDQGPTDVDTRPRPNGCNYVVLNVDGSTALPVRVSFGGSVGTPWHVAVLERGDDGATSSAPITIDDEGHGELSVPLDGLDELVLVVCQLGSDGYDPDDHQWTGGAYHYSMQWDIPAPTVTAVSPSTIEQGAHGVEVTITGEGFVDHDDLDVVISGEKVAVLMTELVSDTELRLRLTVAPQAALGPRDLTVENPGGAAGIGAGLLTVVASAPAPSGEPSAEPDGGCACSAPPAATSRWPWLLGLGLPVMFWRRRA